MTLANSFFIIIFISLAGSIGGLAFPKLLYMSVRALIPQFLRSKRIRNVRVQKYPLEVIRSEVNDTSIRLILKRWGRGHLVSKIR